MDLAQRTATSTAWNLLATALSAVVLFVRSILLARWLPVEVFGIYGFASAVVTISVLPLEFGMGGALVHRAPETEDEERAASVHLTLKLLFAAIWITLMLIGATLWTEGSTRTAIYTLTFVFAAAQLVQTPQLLLRRRVVHRRLALIQMLSSGADTAIALGLAARGVTLWALLATNITGIVIAILLLYIWKPVWHPRLAWQPEVVIYYLRYGSRNFLAGTVNTLVDKLDDLWTGAYLGDTALGLYSRAYRFATYPRSIIAAPVNSVAAGTYAELKGNRAALSQTFFRMVAFMVRLAFGLAGAWFLVAPEFIRIVLGSKWMPMLDTFRLMLIFTMLDPLRGTIDMLFLAVGEPGRLAQIKVLNLVILVVGLFVLGNLYGIVGVALAVDIMLVVGIGLLFWQVRRHVDFALLRIFGPPGLGLILALMLAQGAMMLPDTLESDWRTGAVKLTVFIVVYGGILLTLEWNELREIERWLRTSFFQRDRSTSRK